MPIALVSLGSNLGDRAEILQRAADQLAATPGVHSLRLSRWFETQPVGGPAGQGAFLNGAAQLETSLSPHELLSRLQSIEQDAGRRRVIRWEARPLDLDLLLYDDRRLATPDLIVPHPRMAYRRFVLESAVDVAGGMVHPTIGATLTELLDRLNVAPRYFAIAGAPGSGRNRLARRIAAVRPDVQLVARPPAFDDLSGRLGTPSATSAADLARESAAVHQEIGRLAQGRRTVVSPFWLSQVGLEAAAIFRGSATSWGVIGEQSAGANVSPLLTLFLDAPTSTLLARLGSSPRPELASRLETLCVDLWRLASSPGVGPVLTVDASDDGNQPFDELLAALDATL